MASAPRHEAHDEEGRRLAKFAMSRNLLRQALWHSMIFGISNIAGFAERVWLANDTDATASIGLGWATFCLVYSFADSLVGASTLVIGRCLGSDDRDGARAAVGQAVLLAAVGGLVGVLVAAGALVASGFLVDPHRGAAVFFAIQGVAVGPLLGVTAVTSYLSGAMRISWRFVLPGIVTPVAVHVALAWLLVSVLAWSVVGAGVARLGAALDD